MARPVAVKRPPRLTAAERRNRILDAAREIFIEQGVSGARTREIAERSGVTEAFLYRHFKSKDEMYTDAVLAPVRDGIAALSDAVRELRTKKLPVAEFLQRANELSLAFYTENASLVAAALFSDLGSGREFYAESLRENMDEIGRLIADGAGWTASGIDPLVAQRAYFGIHWTIGLDTVLRRRTIDIPSVARRLTLLFTAGVIEKRAS